MKTRGIKKGKGTEKGVQDRIRWSNTLTWNPKRTGERTWSKGKVLKNNG